MEETPLWFEESNIAKRLRITQSINNVAVVQSWDKLGTLYIDEATFRKEWQYE